MLSRQSAALTPAALPRAARGRLRRSTRDARVCRSALVAPEPTLHAAEALQDNCARATALMAWVPAPVNSPWRGHVYQRDAEEEARLDDKLSAAKAAAEARAARPLTETENYWRKREEPGTGDLCRARAVRAFEAVERVELGLTAGDRVLVVQQELLPGAGWIFATRGDDCGYVPRNYLAEEEASIAETVLVKEHVLTIDSDAQLALSPMDWANRGRAIPCTWFFAHALPPQKLVDALRDALRAFPHFAARYTRDGSGLEPGGAVRVEVRQSTTPFAEAYVHTTSKKVIRRTAHEAYVPSKAGMDPDDGLAATPLLRIRITLFDNGTAVGVLVQHAITDIEGIVAFMRAWSRCARGGDISPRQDRWAPASTIEEEAPERWAPSEKPPEFVGVAQKIRTEDCCVLPLPASTLAALKAAAGESSEPYASTDDVLTARVWRALVVCRLAQLGLPISKAGTTCCLRAANVRQVLGLSKDYAGNATTDICTELPAKELLGARVGAVAGKLRADLLATRTPDRVQARGAFFRGAQKMRQRIRKRFDENSLTFIMSSWSAEWDAVDFGSGPPVALDHGAIAPVVCVFVRRPRGDGVNVYVSLPRHLLGTFSECVFVNETASVLVEE